MTDIPVTENHRKQAEEQVLSELQLSWTAQNSYLVVHRYEPEFRVKSLYQSDGEWDFIYAMDKAWTFLNRERAKLLATQEENERLRKVLGLSAAELRRMHTFASLGERDCEGCYTLDLAKTAEVAAALTPDAP